MIGHFNDIQQAIGQVRSEMRFVAARGLPVVSVAFANPRLAQLDEGIRQFKFRLSIEQRRDPGMQQMLRSLQRLHEDLVSFFGTRGGDDSMREQIELVVSPMDKLTSRLIGKIV